MVLAKRLSDKEKKIIIECFAEGKTVDDLAEEFDCTKLNNDMKPIKEKIIFEKNEN